MRTTKIKKLPSPLTSLSLILVAGLSTAFATGYLTIGTPTPADPEDT
ncbi:hypothetical protein GZ206_01475, partial [Dermatophilus congolensis]|nr:hypothetical protein [Dermatophilus congolensis]